MTANERGVATEPLTTVESALNRIKTACTCASTIARTVLQFAAFVVVTSTPAAAQGGPAIPCDNLIVTTIDNLLTVLGGLGPLLGLLVVMVAMIKLATTRDPQEIQQWRETRNQALIYGGGTLLVGAVFDLLLGALGFGLQCNVGVLP